jgi:DNA-damage-inducible protein J
MDTAMHIRIDTETKERATTALDAMGLSLSDAVRLFLRRVADEQRMPFEIRVPNAATREAMRELDEGKGKSFATVEELMADLNAEDE